MVNGGFRLVGGTLDTRDLAWEWVRLKEREKQEQEAQRARGVKFNIRNIGNATGVGVFGDNTTINATQTLTVNEFVEGVRQLIDQTEKVLPNSDLPESIKTNASLALAELRSAAALDQPDTTRLQRGLEFLKHVMEHAAGHIVGAGTLALIAKLLGMGLSSVWQNRGWKMTYWPAFGV